MKILVVGDWYLPIYEQALYDAFSNLGHNVDKFSWIEYFKYYQYPKLNKADKNKLKSIYYRLQNRFTIGPSVNNLNHDLINKNKKNKYDLIFIYRGTHIYKNTIKKLKKTGAIIFAYNNDDPFSQNYPKYFWRHFIKSIPECDHVFSYREKNINEYVNAGAKSVSILMSYYIKNKNYFIAPTHSHNKNASNPIKIVFIGHFENDGRDDIILRLAQSDYNFNLFGTEWDKSKHFNKLTAILGKIEPIYSTEYNELLNDVDISLVFFSKMNNDQYTRRVFELPITKTLMISERTEKMMSLFNEGSEILFFNDVEEILEKIKLLDNNRVLMEKIKNNAYKRVTQDGHEVQDRAIQIIETYNDIIENYANKS
ncbi:glycosyltransferase [Providencia rettgeri]|nr:glycosyltransferase [Providencia rettgeri]